MGLYDGVTGIAIKPVQGAAQEGVEGFFKGNSTASEAVVLLSTKLYVFYRFSMIATDA